MARIDRKSLARGLFEPAFHQFHSRGAQDAGSLRLRSWSTTHDRKTVNLALQGGALTARSPGACSMRCLETHGWTSRA
jgi:hypothetical protein